MNNLIEFKGMRDEVLKRKVKRLVVDALRKEYPWMKEFSGSVFVKEEEHKAYYYINKVAGAVNM